MKSFYVAGSVHDIPYVKGIMEYIRSEGHVITFDWTGPEGKIRGSWANHQDDAQELSVREVNAVRKADITLLLCPQEGKGLGCFLETGIAIGAERRVWVYSPYDRESVFWYLPRVRKFNNSSELGEAIRNEV